MNTADAGLLLLAKARGWLPDRAPSLIEIGAQQVGDALLSDPELLTRLQVAFGATGSCPLAAARAPALVDNVERLSPIAPRSRALWEWLGFEYAAIDIDGSPDSLPLDLNYDAVPPHAMGRYDLVTNLGTTEHVANQLNAFKIVHDLTRPGGIMMHNVPALGMLTHGLFNYTPKFFWRLAQSNGYVLLHLDYVSSPDAYPLPQDLIDCAAEFRPDIASRAARYRAANAALEVILAKAYALDFVAPVDVPAGAAAPDPLLARRYWTMFESHAFDSFKKQWPRRTPLTRVLNKMRRGVRSLIRRA